MTMMKRSTTVNLLEATAEESKKFNASSHTIPAQSQRPSLIAVEGAASE
jgi:hypothetical protein